MKKAELIEKLSNVPDDYEITFVQHENSQEGEHSEMYVKNISVNDEGEYAEIYCAYTMTITGEL